MRFDAPLQAHLVDELFDFWLPIFEGQLDVTPDVLLGHEGARSLITVYAVRRGGKLAGACLVAASRDLPILGGLGEVATNPNIRRSGIATELSRQARDDFEARGGQALFLGTGNPDAARIYFRLGWRKLAGANLMVNVLNGDSPEEFLVDYFRDIGQATVRTPSPADRIPMIPLLASPHDWQVLDANAAMHSTRYAVQGSCLGLYRRYEALSKDGQGAWFCAGADRGQLVGLSTARIGSDGACLVDGFTHKAYPHSWPELAQAAIGWGVDKKASFIHAAVSVEDEEKQSLFQSIGFGKPRPREPFDLGGRQVAAIRLDLVSRRLH